jgi:5-methylcytosine-specific restriction endonuclease McrA
MPGSEVPRAIDAEIQRLTVMLEKNGYKTRPENFVPTTSGSYRSVHYSQYGHSSKDYGQPQWQDLRSRIFAEREERCQNCKRGPVLELHHKQYFRGRKAWQYPDGDFLVLCRGCHSLIHEKIDKAREYLTFIFRLIEEKRIALHNSEILRLWEEFLHKEREAEYLRATGEDRDPVEDYDPDSAGEWEAEFGEDPGDRAERLWEERDADGCGDEDDDWE